MRVIGGIAKGRCLESPSVRTARPTSELVRGAIFNILGERVVGVKALDIYAGTGALGIEALSRGASWADFVDNDPKQCVVIKRNLESTGFTTMATVHCTDVIKAMDALEGRYDLVLMDPPYKLHTLDPVLEKLAISKLLAEKAVVVVGHSKRQVVKPAYGDMSVAVTRRYGDSQVDFFVKGGATW